MIRPALVLALALAGCAEKPTVPLPEVTSSLRAELVTRLTGPTDVRTLTRAGPLLLVADGDGLFVVDASIPAAPVIVGELRGAPVDHVAVRGNLAFAIAAGSPLLRVIDLSTPAAPAVVAEVESPTVRFGGIDARPGLIWHAVGAVPPSRLYPGTEPDEVCEAPDRERGVMDVWLDDDLAVVSIHFDDFGGDGLDGNGTFGWLVFRVTDGPGCPDVELADIIGAPEHDANRSAFERPSNSDLQAHVDRAGGLLYLTGEQRLRVMTLDDAGVAAELAAIALPEVLDVAVDESGPVAGLANGDFLLVDLRDPSRPAFAGRVETPGVARAVAAAGDGMHFFVGDSEAGVAVLRYQEAP